MKSLMVTRYIAQYEGQHTSWFGTCAQWAAKLPPEAKVTKQRVLVVNPQRERCLECGGQHVRVTSPN